MQEQKNRLLLGVIIGVLAVELLGPFHQAVSEALEVAALIEVLLRAVEEGRKS